MGGGVQKAAPPRIECNMVGGVIAERRVQRSMATDFMLKVWWRDRLTRVVRLGGYEGRESCTYH